MKTLLCPALIALSLCAHAETYTLSASADNYNRIVLPSAYAKVVIPPESALAERPISLNSDRGLLLRPRKNADPIPVFIELKNGESFTVRLVIKSDQAQGGVFRYKNATDKAQKPNQVSRPSDDFIASVMVSAVNNQEPNGMSTTQNGAQFQYTVDKHNAPCKCEVSLDMIPVAAYRGSRHKLSVYKIHSSKLIAIDPRDFWREGVVAVTVESDFVSQDSTPRVFILENDSE